MPKTQRPRKRSAPSSLVPIETLIEAGVNRQHAEDWLAIRKAKNLPLTVTAWEGTISEARLASMSVAKAVEKSAENCWGGFKASWVTAADVPRNGHHAGGGGHNGHGPKTPDQIALRNAEAKRLLGFSVEIPSPLEILHDVRE